MAYVQYPDGSIRTVNDDLIRQEEFGGGYYIPEYGPGGGDQGEIQIGQTPVTYSDYNAYNEYLQTQNFAPYVDQYGISRYNVAAPSSNEVVGYNDAGPIYGYDLNQMGQYNQDLQAYYGPGSEFANKATFDDNDFQNVAFVAAPEEWVNRFEDPATRERASQLPIITPDMLMQTPEGDLGFNPLGAAAMQKYGIGQADTQVEWHFDNSTGSMYVMFKTGDKQGSVVVYDWDPELNAMVPKGVGQTKWDTNKPWWRENLGLIMVLAAPLMMWGGQALYGAMAGAGAGTGTAMASQFAGMSLAEIATLIESGTVGAAGLALEYAAVPGLAEFLAGTLSAEGFAAMNGFSGANFSLEDVIAAGDTPLAEANLANPVNVGAPPVAAPPVTTTPTGTTPTTTTPPTTNPPPTQPPPQLPPGTPEWIRNAVAAIEAVAPGTTKVINGALYVWNGTKWVIGTIGTINTISRAITGEPIIDIGGGGGGGPGGPSGGGPGGGSGTGGGGGGGNNVSTNEFGFGDFINLLLTGGLTYAGANRQENMADNLLAMYNEQNKKAEPWEEMLRRSYTTEGQRDILSSPQFMSQQGSYKQMIDRAASKAGTLTNTMSGIPGVAPRGREAALQKFGYDFLNDYRKQPQSMVDLYTKNASDYKLLAAMAMANEAAIPGHWANALTGTSAGQRLLNWLSKPEEVTRSLDAALKAGKTFTDWWNSIMSGEIAPDNDAGPGSAPSGSQGGQDPMNDNINEDYPILSDEDIGNVGVVGPGWDYSMQDEGVIYDPDGNAWMPDPNTGDWSIVDNP